MARKPRKKAQKRGIVFWIVLFLLIGILAAVWKLWPCLYIRSYQFNYLLIQKNGTPLKLLNGEEIQLKPADEIKIVNISTNICFNRGVRLVAKDFDVTALLYEETTLAALIIDRDIFNRYEFQLMVKYYTQDLGYINVVIEPTVEDWLDKADRSIGEERKIAVLERALQVAPKDARITDRLIHGYIALKRWKQAARLLEEKAKEDPNPDVLYDLLDIYEAMSKPQEIVSTLNRLTKLSPKDAGVRYRLASYLEKTGKYSEAIREYEGLLGMVGKSDKLSIYKTLGFLYAEQNDPKKAIDNYLEATKLDDRDVNLYYNLSFLYEKIGQRDKADLYLSKAVAFQAGDMDSRLKLAERLIGKGQLKEAEDYLRQVLKKQPKTLEALLLMLKIAEKREDKTAIKKYYQEILALDPQNMAVTYNLGVMEYEAGNLEAALNYFQAFSKANPEDREVHVFLFDIYMKQKKPDQAFREARILIGLQPQEISYYRYMFEYLNSRNDFETMIEIMREGLASNPDNTELREYLALAYLKTDREDLAIIQLKEVLKHRPADVPLLLQAARLAEKLGRREDALEFYKRVVEISPGHEEAEDAYLRLRLEALPLGKKNP